MHEFTDDSSTSLGLSHSLIGRPRDAVRLFPKAPAGRRVGEMTPFERGERVDGRTGLVIAPVVIRDNDLDAELAGKTLDEQIEVLDRRRTDPDAVGDPDAVTAKTLQRPTRTNGHGRSSTGRKNPGTLNAPICPDCHLEYCTCGGGEGTKLSRRGRRSRLETEGIPGRSEFVGFRVSAEATPGLRGQKGAGELIDTLGRAIANGVTFERMKALIAAEAQDLAS